MHRSIQIVGSRARQHELICQKNHRLSLSLSLSVRLALCASLLQALMRLLPDPVTPVKTEQQQCVPSRFSECVPSRIIIRLKIRNGCTKFCSDIACVFVFFYTVRFVKRTVAYWSNAWKGVSMPSSATTSAAAAHMSAEIQAAAPSGH